MMPHQQYMGFVWKVLCLASLGGAAAAQTAPRPSLTVTPSSSVNISGPQGGPFLPRSIQYRLSASTGTIRFAIAAPFWLRADPRVGTVGIDSVTVTLSLNPRASKLAPQAYEAPVTFINVTNGQGTTRRPAKLTIEPAPTPTPAPAPAPTPIPGTTLDARQFSAVAHAGTDSDPWPGSAIVDALNALPITGGTVMVADGVWKIDSLLHLNGVNNFNLVGQSSNAQLMFTGAGQMWFGSAGGVSNATISTLTINASTLTTASPQSAMRVSNAQNCSFNNNQVLGHQNGSIPAVFFEGGVNNQFLNNTIIGGPQGGTTLQLQALGGTPSSGFVVSQNTFDSTGFWLIGLNDTKIINNYFHNRTRGNAIGPLVAGPYGGVSHNITLDGNTVDATVSGPNNATISGLPQDPGGTSNIDGFFITNNIIKGTASLIAAQSPDPNNYVGDLLLGNNKKNITITGNQLNSLWTGSVIDIRGGGGTVDTVLVQSNTLQNSAGAQNLVKQDSHTTNVTIQ
jgi:hypothetical protein